MASIRIGRNVGQNWGPSSSTELNVKQTENLTAGYSLVYIHFYS